jgi:hypothetical protein
MRDMPVQLGEAYDLKEILARLEAEWLAPD